MTGDNRSVCCGAETSTTLHPYCMACGSDVGLLRVVANCDQTSMILKGWSCVEQHDAGHVLMRFEGRAVRA